MPTRHVLFLDIVLVALAAASAFLLRFGTAPFGHTHDIVVPFLVTAICVKPMTFGAFGLYRRYWRYTNLADLLLVAAAVAASSMVMTGVVLVSLVSGELHDFPRSVLFIDGALSFAALAGARLTARLFAETRIAPGAAPLRRRRVLVAGAGDSGIVVVRELQKNPAQGLEPVAFVDDDLDKLGKSICGIPVIGLVEAVGPAIQQLAIDEVIIAMPRASGSVVRIVADACRAAGIRSRTVPGLFELLHDTVTVNGLRDVEIADLLRRPQVVSDPPPLPYLAGRVVLVTGAGGSIGRELCRQVAFAAPARIVMVGHGENSIFEAHVDLVAAFPSVVFVPVIADVRDARRMGRIFNEHRPDVVFHAAAYKHVPLMEQHPEEAITNNVLGTATVVEAAVRAGTGRFVLVSTDKAVSPRGLMGASKRMAEAIVRDAGRRHGRGFVVVRFGNVLGSRGSAFPLFRRQIASGGPVTVTDPDMQRFFMTVPEAVHLALQAGGLGEGGELFVLDMGRPLKVVELVRDLITLSGFQLAEIPIVYTGVRPGEKIEEALWEPDADIEKTTASDVLSVTEAEDVHSFELEAAIRQLRDAATRGDAVTIDAVLTRTLPTYEPVHPDSFLPEAAGQGTARVLRRVH